ncbi:MAG: BglG family transcription antiterminator [Microbacteriaceae bacterium]
MNQRTELLLAELRRATRPVTAAELAEALGVTDRSVRNYVAALNADRAEPVVLSGPHGYELRAGSALPNTSPAASSPAARSARILRSLVDARAGIDVHELAASLFVSDSTLESDLGRVRQRLEGSGLRLQRTGARLRLLGPETARRRLLSALFRDESQRDILELDEIQREFPAENLAAFKTAVIEALEAEQFTLNEYGINNVLLHVVIALDRLERLGAPVDADTEAAIAGRSPAHHDIKRILSAQIRVHFATPLPETDLDYLAALVATRVATPDVGKRATVGDYLEPARLASIEAIIERASGEYLVDLSDEDFGARLALHLHNLVNRARDNSFSRNPLTQSMKSSYPMIYELAVFVAGELQQVENIEIHEDEIAYIAMHLGAQLEQQRRTQDQVTAVVVSPAYHELPEQLHRRLDESLGSEVNIRNVITRSDVDWEQLSDDLVVSTITPPQPHDRVVVVTPFFSEADAEAVRTALSRIRRARRRSRIVRQLLGYFDEALFVRDPEVDSPEAMIRYLGERMVAQDIISPAYIEGAIERERLSSTAFTESLAVPHAMTMSAKRTSIAISISERPLSWGASRVRVVAFIAFSESGRASFQEIFDQFVEVFSDEANVQRLVRHAHDFDSFIDELATLSTS